MKAWGRIVPNIATRAFYFSLLCCRGGGRSPPHRVCVCVCVCVCV